MAFVSAFLVLYCFLIIGLWTGWHRAIRKRPSLAGSADPLISVIIPMRNEASAIGALLDSLARQRYKAFEVIVVDDHSEDGSRDVVDRHAGGNLTVVTNRGEGKKRAITTGIAIAKGSLIVTTDADCSVSPEWLSIIRDYFADEQVKFAFGGVRIGDDGTFYTSLQAVEFASLIGSGAATASLGVPTMCNGANLAYCKAVFEDVKGYEGNFAVASGDDEFLLRKVHTRFPGSIRFMAETGVVVETKAKTTLKAFFSQRMRWASKWRHNTSIFASMLAVFIVAVQLSWLMMLAGVSFLFHPLVLVLIFAKLALEACFLIHVSRRLQVRWNWAAFMVLQLVYPLYVIATGLLSGFMSVSWKHRKINGK